MKNLYQILFFLISLCSFSQEYTSSNIHSHNDYAGKIPFYEAFANEVGSVEVDVFLKNNALFVAHTDAEIDTDQTLVSLYLKPLAGKIEKNKGFVFKNQKPLTLFIDLKTEGVTTLKAVVQELEKFPQLLSCKTLNITISGNIPNASQWKDFPLHIFFDGRPNIAYTDSELQRISMISSDFKEYTDWNGKGVLTKKDHEKLSTIIKQVHDKNKKVRFWSTPDNVNAWIALLKLGVDYIGTDEVAKLSNFMTNKMKLSFQNNQFYETYTPKNNIIEKKSKNPKNIILMIGDGMGLAQIYAGYTANRGKLNLFNIPTIGLSITSASDSYITDSAAGGTAMATGQKTNNRFIGVDALGKPIESITKKLASQGYQTAIISSGDMTDATPASFYAHQTDRSFNEAIALDFLTDPSDILIGGGLKKFTNRKDGKNIAKTLQEKGYAFAKNFNSLDSIKSDKFIVLDDASVVPKKKGRGDFLAKAIQKSFATFSQNKKPFFLMAEGAQIDHGGHNNDLEFVVQELLDFDCAVGEAMRYVDSNPETLLIVTADHETGGLSLLDGNVEKGNIQGHFSTNDHTAIPVPVFAYGVGASAFGGVYQNTEIFNKIVALVQAKIHK
jgi:alkaline phosphatase